MKMMSKKALIEGLTKSSMSASPGPASLGPSVPSPVNIHGHNNLRCFSPLHMTGERFPLAGATAAGHETGGGELAGE